MIEEHDGPFLDLRQFLPWLGGDGWRGVLRGGVEKLLGLPRARAIVAELGRRVDRGEEPYEAFLDISGMCLAGAGVEEALPRTGSLVVVANHPFGGADALAVAALCKRVRKDTRVLANAELMGIEPIAESLIPLHVLGEPRADRRNVAALREGLGHVRAGGLLVIFPAGAVSHWQWKTGRVEDPPWPNHAARLILKAGAPVLPVRFFGRNGAWFQLLGALHPFLRSAMIPRAFLAMRGKTVRCEAGPPLEFRDLPETCDAMTHELRRAVERISELPGN